MSYKRIEVKSTSQADFIALMTVLLSAGYKYHDLDTIGAINATYPYTKYPVNGIYIGDLRNKSIVGNASFGHGYGENNEFTLPEDFTKVINAIHENDNIKEPIIINGVGDYDAIITEESIQVGCQTITFKKFEELQEAVKKVRNDS